MDQNQLIALANQFISQYGWGAIAASGLVSPLLSGYKHWLQLEGDKTYRLGPVKLKGEQIIFIMLIIFSALPGCLAFLTHMDSSNAKLLAIRTIITAFMAQPVYLFVLKPLMRSYQNKIDIQVEQRMAQLIAPPAGTTAPVSPLQPTQFK
jgi:hypothetical protein